MATWRRFGRRSRRGARGEERVKGRGVRPSTPPTEQGSHRGVTRHALAVDLHLDQRPLLAPEQVYGYSDCTHVDIVRACACACASACAYVHVLSLKDTPYGLNCASSGQP